MAKGDKGNHGLPLYKDCTSILTRPLSYTQPDHLHFFLTSFLRLGEPILRLHKLVQGTLTLMLSPKGAQIMEPPTDSQASMLSRVSRVFCLVMSCIVPSLTFSFVRLHVSGSDLL